MLKVKDIIKNLTTTQLKYELRMSCYELKDTINNPLLSDTITLYIDKDAKCIEIIIDWSKKCKIIVSSLQSVNLEYNVISWDVDDGNMIEFNDIYIDDSNKLIILI